VTCPMGCTLTKVKTKGQNSVYASKEACRRCPNRCTSSKGHKMVSFGPDTKVSFGPDTKFVPVRMYGSPGIKLNPIPEGAVINPYNHTLDRKDYAKTKQVILRIKEDTAKLKERMCLSEHSFGTVKWYDGAHYLLCKGKEKAAAELGLSFLAYNLKRAINLVGTKEFGRNKGADRGNEGLKRPCVLIFPRYSQLVRFEIGIKMPKSPIKSDFSDKLWWRRRGSNQAIEVFAIILGRLCDIWFKCYKIMYQSVQLFYRISISKGSK